MRKKTPFRATCDDLLNGPDGETLKTLAQTDPAQFCAVIGRLAGQQIAPKTGRQYLTDNALSRDMTAEEIARIRLNAVD